MTGNPLSGHTAANETSMVGSGVFTDSLEDGEHITSPSLTNMLEGVHGNGILLEEDTATAASNRNTPEDLPGVCEQVTNSYTARVTGGSAILDGVLYEFANGPGSSQDIEFTTTSDHARANYASLALSSGQEALIVVYVSTNTAEECITWEMGTPVTTASNTYPTTPSAFLSNPMSSGLDVTQSVVLAVIRVVYSATGGDLNISITESNDKRVFVRPTPLYLTPVTTGIVGNKTAVDSHTALDAVNGDTGNFAGSRMGAIWQSYNGDGDAILYYSAKKNGGTRHTHVLGPAGYVSASPSATTTFTFNEGQVFVLNPSTAIQFNPSGTFPEGHKVFVTNEAAHGANSVTFDNAGIGIVLQGKESGMFVYTGSAWKNVMLASGAISPNGHGANGLIQLSDGAGGFTSDADLSWDAGAGELTIDGKLTVTGLIDPTGLELDPQASNPGGVAANTLWLDSGASNRPKIGTNAVMRASDNISELTNDSGFTDAAAASAAAPVQSVNSATGAVVLDADDLADGTTNVMMTATERTKLSGIETAATADQTGAEIKAAYEGEADTNAFTDAEKTKLSGIATGAEVNVNADWNAVSGDAQILNKPSDVTDLSTHSVTELSDVSNAGSGAIITSAERTKLSGIETAATADQDANEVPVAATPTNYTAATADVEAHLAGIDTALATAGGVSSVFGRTGAVTATSGDYDDGEITAAATATNYTPSAATVEGHLSGIDTALGSVGGGSGTVTSIATSAPITGGTITSTGTIGISAATTSAAGSMSAADKTKLVGIAASATATGSVAKLDCIAADSIQTAGSWITIDFGDFTRWNVDDPDGILTIAPPAPDPTAGNITIGSSSSEMYLVIIHLWIISTANATGNGLWIVRGNANAVAQDGQFFYHREQEYVNNAQSAIVTPIQFTVAGGTTIESIEYYWNLSNFQYRGNALGTTRVSFVEFVRLK